MMQTYHEFYLVPRPARDALFVRSIGHFASQYGVNEAVKRAGFAEFFWCLESSAEFRLDEKTVILNPNEAWYYPVGALHDYRPCREGFHYWWVTLEGRGTEELCRGLELKPGRLHPGPCPEEIFRSIEEKIRSLEQADRLFCLAQIFRRMTLLAQHGGLAGDLASRAGELMATRFTDPGFNVEQMAALLHVSRVVLSRTFSQHYGMAPSEYLHRLRLRKALELFREGVLPVKGIAQLSGFSSQEYFVRVIRRAIGMTPRDARSSLFQHDSGTRG